MCVFFLNLSASYGRPDSEENVALVPIWVWARAQDSGHHTCRLHFRTLNLQVQEQSASSSVKKLGVGDALHLDHVTSFGASPSIGFFV
jgi:hypothetical protein